MSTATGTWSVTIGGPRANARGRLAQLDPDHLVDSLRATLLRHTGTDAWWSGALFEQHHRRDERWQSAIAVGVDLDFHGADDRHAALPDDVAMALSGAAVDGQLPGSLYHVTPRGARLVYVLAQPVTDAALMRQAIRGAGALAARAVQRLELHGTPGLRVDWACTDLARFYFTPRATVDDVQRTADVTVMRQKTYDTAELAAAAPPERERTRSAPPPGDRRRARGRASTSLEEAVARWNADHPLPLPRSGGDCPACGHRGCFGSLKDDPSRWCCYSANHGQDSGEIGMEADKVWSGDALDLAAAERRQAGEPVPKARARILREDGYLTTDSSRNGEPDYGQHDGEQEHQEEQGGADGGAGRKKAKSVDLHPLRVSEILARPAPNPLVKGLVDQRRLLLVYGESGSGKSLVLLDLAVAIATGAPTWGECKVTPGRVLWVAGEAADSMPIRLQAALGDEEGRWDAVEQNLFVIPHAVRFFDDGQHEALERVVREIRPVFLIIDTLAEAFLGTGERSENSASDMQHFLARCRTLVGLGPTLALIHHATKGSEGRTERGSTALRAAADVVWPLVKDDLTVRLDLGGPGAKVRDGRKREEIAFRITIRELGTDDDGDPVSGAFLRPAEASAHNRFAAMGLSAACPVLVRKLGQLARDEWATSSWLREETRFTRQRLSDVVRELTARGLVESDTEGFRRSLRVRLTDKGRSLL